MQAPRRVQPWYREPFLWLVIFFPAAAVVGGLITLAIALATHDGTVVDDYYRQGLEINRTQARDQAAERYGLNVGLRVFPELGRVRLSLDAAQLVHWPDRIELALRHATRAGFDRQATLRITAAGIYEGPLGDAALPAGKWIVEVAANDWRVVGSLFMPIASTPRVDAVFL